MVSIYRLPLLFLGANIIFLLITFGFKLFDEEKRHQILFAQLVLFYQGGLLLVARYIWMKFTTTFPSKTVIGISCRLILAPVTVLSQGFMILNFVQASREPRVLVIASGYSVAILLTVFGVLIIVDFARLIFHALSYQREIRHLRSSVVGHDNIHRLAWKQLSHRTEGIGLLLVLFFSTILLVFSHQNATFPAVRRLEIPVRNLPSSFDGLTIVHLSDLHIGGVVGRKLVRQLVSATNDLHPDLVLVTGDLVDGTVSGIQDAVKPLSSLTSKYGVYLTPGNHDYYSTEIDKWLDFLISIKVTPLRNRRIEISHKKFKHDKFYLIGLDDPDGKFFRGPGYGPKFLKPLKNRDDFTPSVLISHRPSTAKHAIQHYGNIQLALTGHTHGGQIFPLLLWHYFTEPFFNGLYQLSPDSYVYVSPGVFYYAAPLRLLAKGEITHVTLTIGS